MKALVFDDYLRLSSNEPVPTVPKGEALIKILIAGFCNTDIEITKGYMGFKGILGHEFVGIVEEVNDEDKRLLGKRVVGDINCACGLKTCEFCSQGLGRHCPDRTTLGISQRNGCLAEYITLPVKNLLEVPESIPNSIATLTEPLAAGFEILEQIDINPSHEILIVGDGKLGLLINHALSTTQAQITHVGKHAEKLGLIENNDCKAILLNEITDKQYDIVIEATGNANGFDFSVKHTKSRGTLVLKSTIAANQSLDMTPVVVNEITIIGSRCGLFQPALDYLASGVDLSPIISNVYPIDNGLEAFKEASANGSLKILIDFTTNFHQC